jgi:hypothetical protein
MLTNCCASPFTFTLCSEICSSWIFKIGSSPSTSSFASVTKPLVLLIYLKLQSTCLQNSSLSTVDLRGVQRGRGTLC